MVKKVLTIISLVSISLMAGILIVSAVEKSGEKQGEYVSVADNTDDSSIHKGAEKPKVDIKIEKKIDQKKDVVTVTYSEAELKVDENGYAWLKIQLAPLQDGEYYYSDDYYYSIGDNVGTLSDSPYDYYFGLNEDMLEDKPIKCYGIKNIKELAELI